MTTAITESTLLATYLFESEKPSRVKYEIFQKRNKLSSQVTIYRIEPSFGIQGYVLLDLQSTADQPESALAEVRTHFENTYA